MLIVVDFFYKKVSCSKVNSNLILTKQLFVFPIAIRLDSTRLLVATGGRRLTASR